jgi:hypothetical protein
MKRAKLRAGLVAGALTMVGVLGSADPASAGVYPRCNGSTWRQSLVDTATWIETPTYNGDWRCTMRYGEVGNEVRALQRTLNECFGAALSVDGEFGPKTQAALRAAESRMGTWYTVDGIYSASSDNWKDDAWNFRHHGIRDDPNGNPSNRCAHIGPFPSW